MAWTTPRDWISLETVTAALFNTHVRDNLIALREGGIAIASQAAQDFIFAASSTQLGRLAAVSGRVPKYNGSAWTMEIVDGGNAHPIGTVLEFVVSTNPATSLGYGTWVAFGTGRATVGIDAGDADFDTVEETGGAKTHTLSTGEIPAHTHVQDAHTHTQNSHNHTQNAHDHTLSSMGNTIDVDSPGGTSVIDNAGTKTTSSTTATNQAATATNQNTTATNQNTGGGGAHNNLQPYCVVYRWKRTA